MNPRYIEQLVLLWHASLAWFPSRILAGLACSHQMQSQSTCRSGGDALIIFHDQADREEVWPKESLSSAWGPSTGLATGSHCLACTDWGAQTGYGPPSKVSHGPKRGEESAPSSCWLHSRVTHCVSILHHHRGALLTCSQLLLHQDTKVFFCKADPHPVCPQPTLLHGVAPSQVQDSALAFVKFYEVSVSPILQFVEALLNGSPALQSIHLCPVWCHPQIC